MTEWKLIDTAPKSDNKQILAYFPAWGTRFETVASCTCGFARVGDASHWMPLPDPPVLISRPNEA